ncbi:hypothetical protein B296_00019164 [Ensete ventricosum]|uniref:BUB1 N-terminal domain-containing protein n=1 Tax=Ensete ventricosum TaxID=4639 RepID=A0A427APR1_ENSVE|nr:hypothetical protein B296_00019164 [Ensete ventricosum]
MAAAGEPQHMEATSFAAATAEEAEAALLVADADPETAFLQQKDGGVATGGGFEWEVYKENVRPLKRGRDVKLLNHALRSQVDRSLKASLLRTRRHSSLFAPSLRLSLLPGSQCVRTFWHDDRYRDDLRYLKVWLEYVVIFQFLEANQIGQSHSIFYISYAMHLESKNKLRKADEILNLGLARLSLVHSQLWNCVNFSRIELFGVLGLLVRRVRLLKEEEKGKTALRQKQQ